MRKKKARQNEPKVPPNVRLLAYEGIRRNSVKLKDQIDEQLNSNGELTPGQKLKLAQVGKYLAHVNHVVEELKNKEESMSNNG